MLVLGEEVATVFATVKVAVKTWAAPAVGVTTCVMVCVPSATLVVSHAKAAVAEPPTKS